MVRLIRHLACHAVMAGALLHGLASAAPTAELMVADAYARASADGQYWTIGNGAMEQVFSSHEGKFRLISFKNKLTSPPVEYIGAALAGAPFALDAEPFTGRHALEELWGQTLTAGGTIDFAQSKVNLTVKKGDLIGFSAVSLADHAGNHLEWPTTLQYANGRRYNSAEDPNLAQGPLWHYFLHGTGTGSLDPLDEVVEPGPATGLKEKRRAPVGYRAPFEAPMLGSSTFALMNSFGLMRAWRAPANGTIRIMGEAKLVSGTQVRLRIVKIKEKPPCPTQLPPGEADWTLEQGATRQVDAGGRPAVQLDLTLVRATLRAHLHLLAYPGTSVMRQWLELENTGPAPREIKSPNLLAYALDGTDADSLVRYWLCGGTSRPNQGVLRSAPVTRSSHETLLGEKSDNYVPWLALQRRTGGRDGCYLALDYLGTWAISLDHEAPGARAPERWTPFAGRPPACARRATGTAARDAGRFPARPGRYGPTRFRLAISIPVGLHQPRLLRSAQVGRALVFLFTQLAGAVHGPLGQARYGCRPDARPRLHSALG